MDLVDSRGVPATEGEAARSDNPAAVRDGAKPEEEKDGEKLAWRSAGVDGVRSRGREK